MPGAGYRKERTHATGASNRTKEWKPAEQTGPIDFDRHARSTAPILMKFPVDLQVPSNNHGGTGNQDFEPKLAGHDYRQPNSHALATQRINKETRAREQQEEMEKSASLTQTLTSQRNDEDKARQDRKKGHKVQQRWKPDKWFEAPAELAVPLQRDEGNTWNHMESDKCQGEIKGQDRLMRSVRRPEDVGTPKSETGGGKHPVNFDTDEYYPGRDLIDAKGELPGNDYQIRPIHLPDFYNPPPENADAVTRMQRIREVIRQRYAGRPRLIGVFRNCSLTKPGFIFSRDLQQVFDQMGIKVSPVECDSLVKAVDKDHKGAVTFEEFADLIYGDRVNIGGPAHEPQERHVRHVTKTLVDSLVSKGQVLGKAFCEIDPERRYVISKDQFSNALGTACNHISNQAIDFLWAAQFPGQEGATIDNRCVDWRNFMSQLAHFAHDHRAPTPCCVQGRKRQYDLLQRSTALTGGRLIDLDLNRPDQNADDEVHVVADKLVHRHTDLPHRPRDAAFLTPHFVEELRMKALRVERALPKRIPKARLKELLKNRDIVHQDDLIQLLCQELEVPNQQGAMASQEPLYASSMPTKMGEADVMTLDPKTLGDATAEVRGKTGADRERAFDGGATQGQNAGGLALVRADVEAFVSTQHHNRDHEVDTKALVKGLYRPMHEKKQLEYVNDGLNKQRRLLRPGRERPKHGEQPRYENYWQARYMMDQINDAISMVECSNGGKIKPSRVFKCLDYDNDGYITLSDLKNACEKFKIPHQSPDLHAMFSEIDRHDEGSINIGEFTRNFEVFQGSLLDNMQKPIKAVYHEGGVQIAGPLQEMMDARDRAIAEGKTPGNMPQSPARPSSCPPQSEAGAPSVRSGRSVSSSQMSRAGANIAGNVPIIYAPEVDQIVSGTGRVSDVIRARCSVWKPKRAELYTSMPRTRFGMTCYPDTRHVTEATVPLSGQFLADADRFKTTNSVKSIFAVPDHRDPQAEDRMKQHARGEYRIERIRQRQREFTDRCNAANDAATEFDDLKIARKAMNQLNYERRCGMACA
jgi:Ca2+-binding EF-hand superfamily protein